MVGSNTVTVARLVNREVRTSMLGSCAHTSSRPNIVLKVLGSSSEGVVLRRVVVERRRYTRATNYKITNVSHERAGHDVRAAAYGVRFGDVSQFANIIHGRLRIHAEARV